MLKPKLLHVVRLHIFATKTKQKKRGGKKKNKPPFTSILGAFNYTLEVEFSDVVLSKNTFYLSVIVTCFS